MTNKLTYLGPPGAFDNGEENRERPFGGGRPAGVRGWVGCVEPGGPGAGAAAFGDSADLSVEIISRDHQRTRTARHRVYHVIIN